MSTQSPRLSTHACPECGLTNFPLRGHGQIFCTPAHGLAFHNREKGRAAALAPALAWRQKRGSGEIAKAAFTKLCQTLDQYNAEDHAAGRMSAADYYALVARKGHDLSAIDAASRREWSRRSSNRG